MEFAYGPLVVELERRLKEAGVRVPPVRRARGAARPDAAYKRALLQATSKRLGVSFLQHLGRGLVSYRGHPFMAALLAASTPGQLLVRWQRLEVLAHSENRVTLLAVEDGRVRLLRVRTSGGAPTLEEDMLVMGILAGLLEALGARRVHIRQEPGRDVAGRRWAIQWREWARPEDAPGIEPWGSSSDFARAAFALLLEDTTIPLAAMARRLCVSRRTLQRRLGEGGTSFRALARTARVALAGASLQGQAGLTSLTSVAHACGFADSAHLSREFRSLVGIQPSRFLQALRAV
jgi:AraC-like DNA-binding protein